MELQVKDTECRAMLASIGMEGASSMPLKKLTVKMNSLPTVLETMGEPTEKSHKKLATEIVDTLNSGGTIKVFTESGETDAPKAPKAPKAKPARKEKVAREKRARDNFGGYVGSQAAKINAVLAKKAKDIKTLADESGTSPARVRAHLGRLTTTGVVQHTEKGYCLA